MKIYTRTGDQGETGLLGGVRVSKSHLAIDVCGSLDEANSVIGVARAHPLTPPLDKALTLIQHDLFDLGSCVAACLGGSNRSVGVPENRPDELEILIDQFDEPLPALTAFILPSGSLAGSHLHLARAVCRRAERQLVKLNESGLVPPMQTELKYLNRLGDLLFVMARAINFSQNQPETQWQLDRSTGNSAPETAIDD